MSHQVEVTDFSQIYTGSNLVPLLGLRPLGKCPSVYQAERHLLGAHTTLWWGGVLGSHLGEASNIYQAQTGQHLAMDEETSVAVRHVRKTCVPPRGHTVQCVPDSAQSWISRVGLLRVRRVGLVDVL